MILAEWVIAVGVSGLVVAAIAALTMFSARFFNTTQNYVDLDSQSRLAVDRMSREIRQANKVTAYAPEKITLLVGSNQVTYAYNPDSRTLARVSATSREVLLAGCDYARFDIFQRQATNAEYEIYPVASVTNAKIVQLTWNCSRNMLGSKANTETMQSARVVIRKQSK